MSRFAKAQVASCHLSSGVVAKLLRILLPCLSVLVSDCAEVLQRYTDDPSGSAVALERTDVCTTCSQLSVGVYVAGNFTEISRGNLAALLAPGGGFFAALPPQSTYGKVTR